jgi:hypothetical protein
MRLIACLSWYDEQPAQLAELVASMARAGVDHVVAVDGAYALFPCARGGSPSEQADAITHTARGAGLGVTVHVPAGPWAGNEVAKRSWLFELAHLLAEPGEDWLWVLDADEVIDTADGLREQLERCETDVAEVLLVDETGVSALRMLFRAQQGGIRVTGTHSTYIDRRGRRLWAPTGSMAEAEQLFDVRVRHRPHTRRRERDLARRRYITVRDDVGAEGLVLAA